MSVGGKLETAGLRVLRALPPETAHRLAISSLRFGLAPARQVAASPRLRTRIADFDLSHPLGLAAGFDKDGEAIAGLFGLGFSFVEVGTVTPRPQPGNPRPRLFRLAADRALINRMGFNNRGIDGLLPRLARPTRRAGPVGVNIGVNRDSPDAIADFVSGYRRVADFADYVTINVSSPNTPGLRDLQHRDRLGTLLDALHAERAENAARGSRSPPLFLKVAPDLDRESAEAIVHIAIEASVAALIVGNTTTARPDGVRSAHIGETGGLSGAPLFTQSTQVLARMYRASAGQIPFIGVGGISDGASAFAKIRAGASALQLYTALVFEGPGVISKTLEDLERALAREGFSTLNEAVGTGAEAMAA